MRPNLGTALEQDERKRKRPRFGRGRVVVFVWSYFFVSSHFFDAASSITGVALSGSMRTIR
jgi:hypothetical protein